VEKERDDYHEKYDGKKDECE
jgi:chromosome segregation ATPase